MSLNSNIYIYIYNIYNETTTAPLELKYSATEMITYPKYNIKAI